jgi:amino-acid N-acetyltransferase
MQGRGETEPVVRAAESDDLAAIERLLSEAHLPLQGVSQHLAGYLVAGDPGRIVAAIGCEDYGAYGLLRSAVVDSAFRGRGLGRLLTQRLLEDVRGRGIRTLYLLTTTAEDYFPRFGFQRITRDQVPAQVQQSAEFRGACPASAVVMMLEVRSKE